MESKSFCDYSPERFSKWEIRSNIASGVRDKGIRVVENERCHRGLSEGQKLSMEVSFFRVVVLSTAPPS